VHTIKTKCLVFVSKEIGLEVNTEYMANFRDRMCDEITI
jgi:hypothetical protein